MRQRHIPASSPRARGTALLALAAVAAVAWTSALAPRAEAVFPRCFGAASRAFGRPCRNPRLSLTVIPSPSDALLMPNSPCTPIEANAIEPTLNACTFGAPPALARATVALLGDSHAWHWRPAVEYVADALDWEGISTTRASCPYTYRTTRLAQPKRAGCSTWSREVPGWFARHPGISTVFVSDHPGSVARHRNESLVSAQIAGYIAAWKALPRSVKHIIVIRDIPYMHETTLGCVEEAMERHENAGLKCAIPRHSSLKDDPEQLAARQLHGRRVQVIDLTSLFCDRRLCYPVIGGALVYRDADHLTRTFAATVGPYMLHALGLLMKSWR